MMPGSSIVVVVSALLALLLLATSIGKLAGARVSLEIRDALSIPPAQWRLIGAIELPIAIALVVGLWVTPVGIAARLGVCALMIGAIAARVRAGGEQRNKGIVVDVVVFLLALVSLLG